MDDTSPAAILRSQIHGLFHAPKTKEEFDTWVANMPPEMPTAVAVMVTFNYAMEAAAAIVEACEAQREGQS